jgi:hypothetical protein
MTMETENATATVVILDSGQRIRVSETLAEVAERYGDPSGWVAVEDPGDGREKLIRRERIAWIEVEADDAR